MYKAIGILAGAALLAIGAGTASAATFTSDHCTDDCGPQPTGFADITAVDNGGGSISVQIELKNGNGLVGGLNGLTSFTFNSVQNQNITFDFGALNSMFDVSNSATNTAPAGDIHQDGFGTFEYGFNWIGDGSANGGSDPFFGTLNFTLTGTGLTLASFAELSVGGTAAFFALDIISGQGGVGNTGVVDCCVGQPTPFDVPGSTPIPGAVWLFGGGLGLVAMLGGRRKRKQKSVWEVTQNA